MMFKRLSGSSRSNSRRLRSRQLQRLKLQFQSLEERRLLATFTVTNNLDGPVAAAGGLPGSLRQAIFDANANPGADTIVFGSSVLGDNNSTTVNLTAGELEITDTLTMEGSRESLVTIDAQTNSRLFNFSALTGDLTLDGLRLTGGRTTGNNIDASDNTFSGGGIRFLSDGTLTLLYSTLRNSRTVGDFAVGGGVYSWQGDVSLQHSALHFNSTLGEESHGGGIYANAGTVSLANSTVSSNSTHGDTSDTGGIWLNNSSGLITNSTITKNRTFEARSGGLRLTANSGTVSLTIRNSIVADNTDDGTAPDLDVPLDPGANFVVTHSLIGRNTGTTLVAASVGSPDANGNLIGTSSRRIPSRLGALSNNGGMTRTHAPLPDSPVINAGDPLFSPSTNRDQRGLQFLRIADGRLDMGAYEVQTVDPSHFVVTTAFDELDFSNTDVSLREAVEWANGSFGSDTITFDPTVFIGGDDSLIRLPAGELAINENLTIDGSTGTEVTITGDANGDDVTDSANITDVFATGDALLADNSMVLSFRGDTNTDDLTLVGLTLTGGFGSSGAGVRFLSGGTLSLIDTSVVGNAVHPEFRFGFGGGIANFGGLFSDGSSLELTNSRVSGNRSSGGGGGGIGWTGSVTLTNSIVSDNSVVSNYQTGSRGGGISMRSRDSTEALTLINSIVRGNDSGNGNGGGIGTLDSPVTLINSTVSGNRTGTSFNVEGGGGIYTRSGAVTLIDSTVSGNFAFSDSTDPFGRGANGGGVNTDSGTVTLTNSTVSGNSTAGDAGGYGGGVFSAEGSIVLKNSTVSGNSSVRQGGGVFTYSGALTLADSTLAGNSSESAGGGISFDDSDTNPTLVIENSIVAGNTGNGNAADVLPDPDSTLTINNSLIGDTIGSGINSTTGTGNILDQPALLGPLAFNGGLTKTHALLPGSPAIDAGNSTESFDQRGLPRVVDLATNNAMGSNGADIGAFEMQAIEPIGTSPLVASTVRDEGGVLARPDLLSTFAVSFDVDVNVSVDDLIIRNDTLGGTAVDTTALTLDYDSLTNTAEWDFGSLMLEPSYYSFELSSDIVSTVGNLSLDGDFDGNPGGTFIESIYVALPGDANLDGQVNVLGDAFALVGNLGVTGGATWAEGDFNGDGNVNVLGDAFALVGSLGESVVPPSASLVSTFAISSANDETPIEATQSGLAFAAVPAVSFNQQEEDREQSLAHVEDSPLELAGTEDLDTAFGNGLIDDGLF
jgi:hypothetical protein